MELTPVGNLSQAFDCLQELSTSHRHDPSSGTPAKAVNMKENILPVDHLSSDVLVADYPQHLAVDIDDSPEARRPALMSSGIVERLTSRTRRQKYFTWTQVSRIYIHHSKDVLSQSKIHLATCLDR